MNSNVYRRGTKFEESKHSKKANIDSVNFKEGFARVKYELQQINEFAQIQEAYSQTGIQDDAIFHVFGAERPGRVRGLGFGVTPSMVHTSVEANKNHKAVMDKMNELQENVNRVDTLQEQLKQLHAVVAAMASQRIPSNVDQFQENPSERMPSDGSQFQDHLSQ